MPLLYRSLDQGLTVSQRHIGVGEIYAKVLRRVDNAGTSSIEGEVSNQQALTTTGKLQNLLSADVLRAAEALAYVQNIFPQGALRLCVCVIYCDPVHRRHQYHPYRLAALPLDGLFCSRWRAFLLAAFALGRIISSAQTLILVLLIPIQSLLAKMWANISREVLTASDKRLHLAQEVIQAIRVVKAFAWERRCVYLVDVSSTSLAHYCTASCNACRKNATLSSQRC